ncbi:FtsB family cell division protein [Halothiobacillus sp. DCM-1]|uniref:FtsB family cell division protein n=1 Tax=Halothiobacillus sp. DCM-1 TaxID=3112558 RepID=UPI00325602B2
MASRIIALLVLLGLLAGLQWRLWSSDSSFYSLWHKQAQLAELKAAHESLAERNRRLFAEVDDLKTGLGALGARARLDLGLIGPDETFFQVIEDTPSDQITPTRGDAQTLSASPSSPTVSPPSPPAPKAASR